MSKVVSLLFFKLKNNNYGGLITSVCFVLRR